MAVLVAGKLMSSGLQVPVGIRNIIHIPAGDELLQKWKFVLPRHDKELGGGSYEDMVGKENGLFIGGWTFLFNKFKAVKDSLWGSNVKVNHRWPHAAVRGNFGIGNALTEATASTFEAIKSTPNYSPDTAVGIERLGVLAPVMPEVVNGRKLFPLQNILGIDLREEKIEASKANMARILAAQPGKLSDFEQRLRLRYQTVFKNLGIDSTVCMQYMQQNFDITNLLGVGHPSSYRATINAQRLNLQTMPRFAHYISGGPLYIGSLREV